MSMATLEREILRRARVVTNNPKLRISEICEWVCGPVADLSIQRDEVGIDLLSPLGVSVAVLRSADKR